MTHDLTLRPIARHDRDDWQRLWTLYLEFYEATVTAEVYDTAFERILSDDPHEFRGLIAHQDGKAVGLAHYLFHRMLWTVEDTCYLLDLFVDPGIRGQGVGRALIEAAHRDAAGHGIPGIYWMTQETNYKGRMLYDKLAERTPFVIYEKNS